MAPIGWPTGTAIGRTIQMLTAETGQAVGTDFCSVVTEPMQQIKYWEEYGPQGKTLAHSLGADVKPIPWGKMIEKIFSAGYFKEKMVITEKDILTLAELNDTTRLLGIESLVGKAIKKITHRARNLINWAIWQAVMTGQVSIDENGVKFTANYGIPAQNLALTVAVAWSSTETALCVKDITSVYQSFVGTGYKLGKIKLNSATADLMIHCKDTKTFWNGTGVKEKLGIGNFAQQAGNFTPGVQWEVTDEGYTSDAGVFTKYIPDNKILFLGNASDLMDYASVPHVENGKPAASANGIFVVPDYTHVNDANPYAEIFGGTYGLPRIYRPTLIFVMDVTQVTQA